MDTKDTIRDFILKELCPEQHIESLADEEELIESGIIDSMAILNLLAFLEENFGVLLVEDELNRKNFATIQSICELVIQNISSN